MDDRGKGYLIDNFTESNRKAPSEGIGLGEGSSNATLLMYRIFNGSSYMDAMALSQRTSNGAPMALSSGKSEGA
ncbi:MAG: hypothetical protein Q9167_005560 [Letrouitia subvulpina]